jgi:hypothetical protein
MILLPACCGLALAQNSPDAASSGAPTTMPAPATPAPPPPAATAAPAQPADQPAAATAQPSSQSAATTPATESAPKTKKKSVRTTRRHEIEKSINAGTVPSRYRSAVPKEYQQYIPFSKD